MPPKVAKKRQDSDSPTSPRAEKVNPNKDDDEANEHDAKRRKRCPEDDLICPITLELPIDPVTAEDGQHYERSAIETHINNHQGEDEELKSPVLNEGMGHKLLPAPRIKNHIETLVETGIITGDLADKWKEKREEKQWMEILMGQAEKGDAVAMFNVAANYITGKRGFKQDFNLAFKWLKRAHSKGNNDATGQLGALLVKLSDELPESRENDIMYLGLAAGKGSKFAAFMLGRKLATGEDGLTADNDAAIYWFKKSLRRGGSPISDDHKKMAKDWLEVLTASAASDP